MRALAVFFLAALSCSRCQRGEPPALADAGKAVKERRSIDLKTALFTVYPEFRFSRIEEGYATYRRRLRWKLPEGKSLTMALSPLLAEKGFTPSDGGGGAIAVRRPFELAAEQVGEEVMLAVSLPIGNEDVGRLLQSPAPMNSEQLGLYVPMPAGAEVVEETFVLFLRYSAREDRAESLVRQLVELLTGSDWEVASLPGDWPDGGAAAKGDILLRRSSAGTVLHIERGGEQVRLELTQPLH
ncbi:MAG: hypothetical protein HYZ28_23595 [Myxococcales bacterium]|nr:hypothetical protein [Myxococcales bacterium]